MKVVFLFDYPVSERDAARCGFATLRENGFEVDVWDVTPYMHPEVDRRVTAPDPLRSQPVRRFESAAAVAAALAELSRDTFLVMFVYHQLGALSLYRAIGRLELRYAVMVSNALPRPVMPSGREALLPRLARLTPRKIAWKAVSRIPFASLGIPPAAIVIAGGEESLASQRGFYPVGAQSRILWTHSPDYDHYLAEQATPRVVNERQAVFLDEYLPFHPDYEYLKLSAPASAEAYYPKLRAYFDWLERRHDVTVVIAAHPRSQYEKHPDYFDGRDVIRGRTAELVRTSAMVLAHSSTSLNYAVMFERPVVFLTTDTIDAGPYLGRYIAEMASRLDGPRVNLDRPESTWEGPRPLNREAYARYRNDYIKKTGSLEQPVWQIVAEELKRQVPA